MNDWKKMLILVAVVASFGLFAGGCAKKSVQPGAGVESGVAGAPAARADVGEGMGEEEPLTASGIQGGSAGEILEGRTSAPMLPVYFDFDKSNIRPDQQPRLKKNGEFLLANPSVRIRIEGNCDERGTNEYNMALGERRALAAKKFLVNMGVAASRMDTISYGEERPLNYGHDELAWSQNRRDDFVIVR